MGIDYISYSQNMCHSPLRITHFNERCYWGRLADHGNSVKKEKIKKYWAFSRISSIRYIIRYFKELALDQFHLCKFLHIRSVEGNICRICHIFLCALNWKLSIKKRIAIASRNKGLEESIGSQSLFYLGVCLQINRKEETNSFLITVKLPGVRGNK